MKWQDFNLSDCTWEPQNHLPQHVISNYIPSQIDSDRLRRFSVDLERSVSSRLKSKNPVCSVYVDLDVFRYIFGDVSSKLCGLEDFVSLQLPTNWFYILDRDGTGKKLKFPIKLTPRLVMRKVYVKEDDKLVMKTIPIEKCNIYSCTEACSMEDL